MARRGATYSRDHAPPCARPLAVWFQLLSMHAPLHWLMQGWNAARGVDEILRPEVRVLSQTSVTLLEPCTPAFPGTLSSIMDIYCLEWGTLGVSWEPGQVKPGTCFVSLCNLQVEQPPDALWFFFLTQP
jgi:hypothetical protein